MVRDAYLRLDLSSVKVDRLTNSLRLVPMLYSVGIYGFGLRSFRRVESVRK